MGTTDLSSQNRVFDQVRRQWVKLTPEEGVRQALLHRMIDELNYPKELIAVEKDLGLGGGSPHPQRRIDIVCFTKNLKRDGSLSPLILIECKRGKRDPKNALNQVIGYNYFVKAPFVAVANEEGVVLGFFDRIKGEYCFQQGLPLYQDLIHEVDR